MRENIIIVNPTADLLLPKTTKQLPRNILSKKEIDQIIKGIKLTDPCGLRDRTLIEFLYATGIRRMELANLQVQDLNTDRKLLRIIEGKGRKDRYVPLSERAIYWLTRYLEEWRKKLANERSGSHLFLTIGGAPFRLIYVSIWIRNILKRAGIKKEGAAHLFRHACATHLLEAGMDIRNIQQLLGHSCIRSTQIYTQVSLTALQKSYQKYHPSRLNLREKKLLRKYLEDKD